MLRVDWEWYSRLSPADKTFYGICSAFILVGIVAALLGYVEKLDKPKPSQPFFPFAHTVQELFHTCIDMTKEYPPQVFQADEGIVDQCHGWAYQMAYTIQQEHNKECRDNVHCIH